MAPGLSSELVLDAALELIEFPRVLERIARYAGSPAGARLVLSMRPLLTLQEAEDAIQEVHEMQSLVLKEPDWEPPPIPEVDRALQRLPAESAVLAPEELRDLGVLLASSRRARSDLHRLGPDWPFMLTLAARLTRRRRLEESLSRSFDASGAVTDAASTRLLKLRATLRTARKRHVGRLEEYARSLPRHVQVTDASVTLRSGRYCVSARREGMSEIGGIVHDQSGTGHTLFVEPSWAVEPMNRVLALVAEEATEVEAVLRQLTESLRPHGEELSEALRALSRLDSLHARCRYALKHGGSRPTFLAERSGGYRIVRGRHPLLLDGDEEPVPFDLVLAKEERVLLVSGPNAGGKTVLLKAVGLLSALAQSGVIPPVGPSTTLPVFSQFFAVIGDQQSIEASLSTFSAQLGRLRVILEQAGSTSLVLFDELGGHTDPVEGGALAAAVLLALSESAGLTVATTHLGSLKDLALEDPRIVNASLEFDTDRIRPTFRLRRDVPGRSYTLDIAQRLGLPSALLREARSRVSSGHSRVEELLASLEVRERELLKRDSQTRRSEARLQYKQTELESRERDLSEKLGRAGTEARDRAEKLVLSARQEIERILRRLSEEYPVDAAAASRRARVAAERLLQRVRVPDQPHSSAQQTPVSPASPREAPNLDAGDQVRSISLGVEGRILELRGGDAVLLANGLRVTVSLTDLEKGESSAAPARVSVSSDLDKHVVAARTEIDLRGLRADEAESRLVNALDAAIIADLPFLRVIHGKGTGVLRATVESRLLAESRVARFRPGAFDEGGSGVTVVEFGEGHG